MTSRRFVIVPTFPGRVSPPSSGVSKNNKLHADPQHPSQRTETCFVQIDLPFFSSATPMNEINCWARNRKPYNGDDPYDNGLGFLVDGLDVVILRTSVNGSMTGGKG